MYKISKDFKWEMGHKLFSSYSAKCENIHGHSYSLKLEVGSNSLHKGVVEDFGKIKNELLLPLKSSLDHTLWLYYKDDFVRELRAHPSIRASFNASSVKILSAEPTAENIAGYIFQETCRRIENLRVQSLRKINFELLSVEVKETSTSSALVDSNPECKLILDELMGSLLL